MLRCCTSFRQVPALRPFTGGFLSPLHSPSFHSPSLRLAIPNFSVKYLADLFLYSASSIIHWARFRTLTRDSRSDRDRVGLSYDAVFGETLEELLGKQTYTSDELEVRSDMSQPMPTSEKMNTARKVIGDAEHHARLLDFLAAASGESEFKKGFEMVINDADEAALSAC